MTPSTPSRKALLTLGMIGLAVVARAELVCEPGSDAALAQTVSARLAGGGVSVVKNAVGCLGRAAGRSGCVHVSNGAQSVTLTHNQYDCLTQKKMMSSPSVLRELAGLFGLAPAATTAQTGAIDPARVEADRAASLAAEERRRSTNITDPFGQRQDTLAPPPAADQRETTPSAKVDFTAPVQRPDPVLPPKPPVKVETPVTMGTNITNMVIGMVAVPVGLLLATAGAGVVATAVGTVIVVGGVAYAGYYFWQVLKPMTTIGSVLAPRR